MNVQIGRRDLEVPSAVDDRFDCLDIGCTVPFIISDKRFYINAIKLAINSVFMVAT